MQELRIGAFVAKFKKSPDAGVADAAKSLIKKWKSLAAEARRPAPRNLRIVCGKSLSATCRRAAFRMGVEPERY